MPRLLILFTGLILLALPFPAEATNSYVIQRLFLPADGVATHPELTNREKWIDFIRGSPPGRVYNLYKQLAEVGIDFNSFDLEQLPYVLGDDHSVTTAESLASVRATASSSATASYGTPASYGTHASHGIPSSHSTSASVGAAAYVGADDEEEEDDEEELLEREVWDPKRGWVPANRY